MKVPTLVSPENYTQNTALITAFRWTSIPVAQSYLINVSSDSLFNNIIINKSVKDTIYSDTDNLLYSTQYYWRVKFEYAYDSIDWSGFKSFFSIKGKKGNTPKFLWAKVITSEADDYSVPIKVDKFNNLYASGIFGGSQIDLGNGISLQNNNMDTKDSYIAKYNTDGVCLWAQKIGGYDYDQITDLAIDTKGNIYIIGGFKSYKLEFNNGIVLNRNFEGWDAFIAKYNPDGICLWAHKIEGCGYVDCISLSVSATGSVFITGESSSSDIVFSDAVSVKGSGGGLDVYLAKYNTNGLCQWAKIISGYNDDFSSSITVDASENIYIAGAYTSNTFYFKNTSIVLQNNMSDYGYATTYLAKYNSNGRCLWAQNISDQCSDNVNAIRADSLGDIFIIGGYQGSTQNFNNGKILKSNTSNDVYLAKYNSNGICQWATSIRGFNDEFIKNLTLDNFGNIFVAGYFASSNLNFNNGIYLPDNWNPYWNSYDAFVSKYDSNGRCQWAQNIASPEIANATGIAVDLLGNVYINGCFNGDVIKFDSSNIFGNKGYSTDAYIAKFGIPTSTSVEEPILAKNELIIKPNPAFDYVEIGINSNEQ